MKVLARFITLTFVVSAWVSAWLFYRDLPEAVPRHWNALGRPNAFTEKPWGPFVLPLTMTAVWMAAPLLRRIAPKRQRTEHVAAAFEFRLMLTIGLMFLIWTFVVAQSVSWLSTTVPLGVGLVVIGSLIALAPSPMIDGLGLQLSERVTRAHTRRPIGAVSVLSGIGIVGFVALGR